MANFEIWKEKPSQAVYLRLVEREGDVHLIACDENGNKRIQGEILAITKTGKLRRFSSLNRNLGFEVDRSDDDRIKEIR